jgi:hypothetical protein
MTPGSREGQRRPKLPEQVASTDDNQGVDAKIAEFGWKALKRQAEQAAATATAGRIVPASSVFVPKPPDCREGPKRPVLGHFGPSRLSDTPTEGNRGGEQEIGAGVYPEDSGGIAPFVTADGVAIGSRIVGPRPPDSREGRKRPIVPARFAGAALPVPIGDKQGIEQEVDPMSETAVDDGVAELGWKGFPESDETIVRDEPKLLNDNPSRCCSASGVVGEEESVDAVDSKPEEVPAAASQMRSKLDQAMQR